MQQRVGIARGLIHNPSMLLMDEPFAALDAMSREFMMDELQRIWMTTGKSVLFITHSIPEAVYLSDRVITLSPRPGRVIDDIKIELPRARDVATMGQSAFGEYATHLRALFKNTGMQAIKTA
jgi:NitT/TauT family transport system ATP-binding protein